MKCFRYILMCGYIKVTQMTCCPKKEKKKEPVSYRLRSISAQVFVPLDHDVLFPEGGIAPNQVIARSELEVHRQMFTEWM